MFQPTIDKEELKKLPLQAFPGTIHVIDSMAGLKKYLPNFNAWRKNDAHNDQYKFNND